MVSVEKYLNFIEDIFREIGCLRLMENTTYSFKSARPAVVVFPSSKESKVPYATKCLEGTMTNHSQEMKLKFGQVS